MGMECEDVQYGQGEGMGVAGSTSSKQYLCLSMQGDTWRGMYARGHLEGHVCRGTIGGACEEVRVGRR